MLMGDGIKKDTLALGVFVITLHYASDLSAQDGNGKSDPYSACTSTVPAVLPSLRD